MRANRWRGEVELKLSDRTLILTPTFAALCAIETELKTGIIALAKKLAEGEILLRELAVIIAQTSGEHGIGAALIRGEMTRAMQSVAQMFALILGGCDERF